MTRLYLVRHGHTPWDDCHRLKGQVDVPLSTLGECQAARAADYFRGADIAAVYASTLGRTQRTACLLALGRTVLVSPLLDERNWGLWQGLTGDEIRHQRTERQTDWSRAAPLGEPLEAFAARTRLFLQMVANEWARRSIVAVTHEGVIKNAVLPALGLPVGHRSAFGAETGSISLLAYHGNGWRPVFLNCDPDWAARHCPPTASKGAERVGEAVRG